MNSRRQTYLTTAIPYINGDPHLGHALELVQADVLARHRRARGDAVRLLTGTDDNALKNVLAAEAAGVPVAEFVARNGDRFEALGRPLQVASDDYIRTSTDPRHRPGVERLWRACADAGDLYQRDYEGLYCRGCEAFLTADELRDGRCPEHAVAPEPVRERNWFFRLSRHEAALREAVESGRLRIESRARRNEVLAFIAGGLSDFSVSRSIERAHGWGIPVPGDPSQVIYVWFDALANYITALDYGTGGDAYERWWRGSDERVHVIGKGITRFHAIYWPAILRSAGEPLPTAILVHDYVTVEGQKIAKSLGTAIDPLDVVARCGSDALRWWFAREVPPVGDADVRYESLAARANELADGIGNLVNRTITLAARHPAARAARDPASAAAAATTQRRAGDAAGAALPHHDDAAADGELTQLCVPVPAQIDDALRAFDLRAAAAALWELVAAANRYVSATRPWELSRSARAGDAAAAARLDAVLGALLVACRVIAQELDAFLPEAAQRIERALDDLDPQQGRVLFRKIQTQSATANRNAAA